MKKWLSLSILMILAFLSFSFSQGQDKPLDPGTVYESAMQVYHKGHYDEALHRFYGLTQSFPTSKLVPYGYYMMAMCYFKAERHEEALQQFEFYVKVYPDGDRVEAAETGIQIARERLKEKAVPLSREPSEAKETGAKYASGEKKSPSEQPRKIKRRICAQIFYFDAENLGQVEKRIKTLKAAGVDTLILRVFQNKENRIYKFVSPQHEEGVYFKTDHAPVVQDILGQLAEMVHRNGLEIFAWMTTRDAGYGLDGQSEFKCKKYNFETKKMELSGGLNLFHPQVLNRLEGLFRDLGRYPIDGILFQDDLILKHNEDFGAEANKAFLKEFGYSPHPDLFYIGPYKSDSGKYYVKAYSEKFWQWANWKNRWLMMVAQRLMSAARESNPKLVFAINLYYEAVLNHSNGVAWFSQTLSEALGKGFDYYAVMAYHRQTMRELHMEERKAVDLMAEVTEKAVRSAGDPSRVMMKVQILDWKSHEIVPVKEVERILGGILGQGQVSLAFVPYLDPFALYQLKSKWTNPK